MASRYFSAKQLAELLGISLDTVRALIASGKLAASDISGGSGKKRWRVSSDDLDAFLASRRNVKPPKQVRRKGPNANIIEFY